MEHVEIGHPRSLLMESTIALLHGELARKEIERRTNRAVYKEELEKERTFQEKMKVIEY